MKQQKQGNTLTGVGGARLRIPPGVNNQDVILKDLQSLQSSIEELMGKSFITIIYYINTITTVY